MRVCVCTMVCVPVFAREVCVHVCVCVREMCVFVCKGGVFVFFCVQGKCVCVCAHVHVLEACVRACVRDSIQRVYIIELKVP